MQESKSRVLPLLIDNPSTLQAMWMPFILSGAVFVPDVAGGELDEKIFLLLMLPGLQDGIAVSGQVVWVNPAGISLRQGVGIRLQDTDGAARTAIENCLAGLPPAGKAFYCQAAP